MKQITKQSQTHHKNTHQRVTNKSQNETPKTKQQSHTTPPSNHKRIKTVSPTHPKHLKVQTAPNDHTRIPRKTKLYIRRSQRNNGDHRKRNIPKQRTITNASPNHHKAITNESQSITNKFRLLDTRAACRQGFRESSLPLCTRC